MATKVSGKEGIDAILEPFRRARDPLALARAENLLRTEARRGNVSPELIEDAAKSVEKDRPDIAAQIRKAKAVPVTDASKFTVAEHRANLNTIIGDRQGERKIQVGIYNCLIDILEALQK